VNDVASSALCEDCQLHGFDSTTERRRERKILTSSWIPTNTMLRQLVPGTFNNKPVADFRNLAKSRSRQIFCSRRVSTSLLVLQLAFHASSTPRIRSCPLPSFDPTHEGRLPTSSRFLCGNCVLPSFSVSPDPVFLRKKHTLSSEIFPVTLSTKSHRNDTLCRLVRLQSVSRTSRLRL
jgi:hypothetical protein